MPSVFDVLRETMMFTAGPQPPPLPAGAPVSAPTPSPTVSHDHAVRLENPVWSWTHDPGRPARISGIKSKVLGMGMNYAHPMAVCDEIRVDKVSITTMRGKQFDLPLDPSFVMFKFKADSGAIPAGSSGFWRLEAKIDQSILIVFGYQVVGGDLKPFTREQAAKLGDNAMPSLGQETSASSVVVGQKKDVVLSPLRVLVCFSLTCCKERNDFEPGGVLGANRIYPHVMVMPSMALKEAAATITVSRPLVTTPAHDDEEMGKVIGPILIADTNSPKGNIVMPAIPHWDNMFDYYELDPIGNGVTDITVVDPKRSTERKKSGLIKKENKVGFHTARDLRKMRRQGDFGNLHLATRMKIPSRGPVGGNAGKRTSLHLDDIAMAPFCVHDCLHTHFRWGVDGRPFVGGPSIFPYSVKGFDTNFNPNSTDGAPLVPHNQTVVVRLLSHSSFSYTATAGDPIDPGRWQVFFHHGMAYANEIFDEGIMAKAREAVGAYAVTFFEQDFSLSSNHSYVSRTADTAKYWSVFYWRLRFGGAGKERLMILDAKGARDL